MVHLGGDHRKPYGSLEMRLGGKEGTGGQKAGNAVDNRGSVPPGTTRGQY